VRPVIERLEARDVPGFLAPVSYVVGNGPHDVATADVNGDGRLDVIVAVAKDNRVAVLLGNGDGTLLPPAFYPAGTQPYGVAVADLNGDGRPDIVVANYYPAPYLVSVLLNNGNGSFGPPQSYAGADRGSQVALGDVDGDHVPDVAVDSTDYGYVWVFHGNGDGTLNPNPKVSTMPSYSMAPMSLHITDLDGDGVGDISADQPSYLTVVYSSGAKVSYPTGNSGTHAVADVNKDGWPDVVIGQPYGTSMTVGVMLNRSDGTLKPPAPVSMGGETAWLAIADFNRDRKPDIAATLWGGGGQFAVALGNGDGTFEPPTTYSTGLFAENKAAGDLNHDRYPDLVLVNSSHQTIHVLLNDGNWTAPIPPPSSGRPAEPVPVPVPSPDAGRSAEPMRVRDDSAVVAPEKETVTAVASLPLRVQAARESPDAIRVLQEPFA
jgi:hypothetical protein